jgi:alkane 1-monooxygenase
VAATRATQAPQPLARPSATPGDYLKFASFHLIGLAVLASLAAGGPWPVLGFVAINLFYVAGDALLGDDTRTPRFRHPDVLTVLLWAALPLLALIVFVAVWRVSPGDPLGFGAWVTGWSGRDIIAARDAAGWPTHLATVLQTGLLIGMIGTIPAHELTHRTWDRVSLAVGRWLLAFSFDTTFAIEHVYGHHRAVATADDPATAPRGRSVYRHIWESTWRGNRSAWRIETARLRRLGLPVWSPRNAVLRGTAMSGLLLAAAAALGGAAGLVMLVAAGLWGKALLEIVNYMEHYGLVRVPGTPVQPRHSWNTNRRLSSWSLFNLTRHSHHHAEGEVPFQDLQPMPQAPQMIGGYLTTIGVALFPPLWHRLMTPRVLTWDRDFASPAERALAREANARSGLSALQGATTA